MACNNPSTVYRLPFINQETGKRGITFKSNEGIKGSGFFIPCYNKCAACLKKRAREWAIRCYCELTQHKTGMFLTLSYDPKHLPEGNTLCKRDFQLFLKRYRKYLKKVHEIEIRLLYCGEYGEAKGRAHYHAMIFGHSFGDKELFKYSKGNTEFPLYTSRLLDHLWGKGKCFIGEANYLTSQYVAKYITKVQYGKAAEKYYGDKVKPFIQASRDPPIGIGWLEKFHAEVYPHDQIQIEGYSYPPPRCFDKWMEERNPSLMLKIHRKRMKRAIKHLKDHPEEYHDERLVAKDLYIRLNGKNSDRWHENKHGDEPIIGSADT